MPEQSLDIEGKKSLSWRNMLLIQPPQDMKWQSLGSPTFEGTIRAGTLAGELMEKTTRNRTGRR